MKQLVKSAFLTLGYALRVSVTMLLCGLSVGLSSCEKEVPGQGAGNGNVELKFVLSGGSYDADDLAVRSDGGLAPELERVVVPVGNGSFLYATLEPDLSAPLRADKALLNDTRVMIAAYKNGTTYETSAEYKVSGSGLVPTAANGKGLEISGTGSYRFAAYSKNSATQLTLPPTVASDTNQDLLYGDTTQAITAGTNTIKIRMKHQFSRVKASITAMDNIIDLGTVSISPVYSSVQMQVSSGKLTPSGSKSQDLPIPPGGSGTTRTSKDTLVYTAGEPFSLTVAWIEIKDRASITAPVSFEFKNTTLNPGKRYTLSLSFRTVEFAASNIYWNSALGKLTFDEGAHDTTVQKQGLFFKFGSLIGISAGQTNNSNDFTTSTVVYVPTYNEVSKAKSWSRETGKSWAWIPYCATTLPANKSGLRYDDTVINSAYNTSNNWRNGKGDICQFLNEKYRLPYSYEFGAGGLSDWQFKGDWESNANGHNPSGTVDGTGLFGAIARHKTGYCFPGSGLRANLNGHEGELENVRFLGGYWSGSASDNTQAFYCWLTKDSEEYHDVFPAERGDRQEGRSVRCVKR